MVMSFKPFKNPNSNGWNIISKENERRVLKLQAIYMKEIVQILLPVVEKKIYHKYTHKYEAAVC